MEKIFDLIIKDFEFPGDVKKDSYELLVKHGRIVIAEHTLRVAAKARSLAVKYGIDEEAAELAAFLHDIGGVYPNNERLKIAELLGLNILISDKLEWDKKGIPPYSKEVEEALLESLELAAFKFIKYQLKDREKLAVVHPWLLEAFEDLEYKINN